MKLLLLDGNSLVNRAFYALPNLTDSTGRATGGVFGFVSMLAKLIQEEQPTHIACAFDVHAPTFRHKQYDAYKAGRHATPEALIAQIPLLKEVLDAMKVCRVELAGYEADDILGTLSAQADMPVIVVSGDKDVLQLVSDNVTVYHTKRGITEVIAFTPEKLKEEGLLASQVPELKGLMGDSSDNIKGVAGVGEKTARALLESYFDLDGIYAHLDEIKGKLKENLTLGKESAYFSRDLATICRSVPLSIAVSDCAFNSQLPAAAADVFRSLDFKNLVGRFTYDAETEPEEEFSAELIDVSTMDELRALLSTPREDLSLAYVTGSWHFAFDSAREYRIVDGDLLSSLTPDEVLVALSEAVLSGKSKVWCYDLKSTYYLFREHCAPFSAEDVMLLCYVKDAGNVAPSSADLAKQHDVNVELSAAYQLKVGKETLAYLVKQGCDNVYYDIELPLVPVLYDMEQVGFPVDVARLRALGEGYAEELSELTRRIHGYAGNPFNINSPKQLREVLFDKLGLPTDKKRSTNAEKLEKLSLLHPIVPDILRYRQIAKLNSTYVEGMLPLLDGANKLHTVFKQAVTTTGRLSSTEPNLQNIPVRTEEGRAIRSAFCASEGNRLVVADYSQIELRLMAHYSDDEGLVEAFRNGHDIHTATAAKIYGVSQLEVSADMRRSAKAVNFGIIYGISDYGLSQNIGSTVAAARDFIERYFALHPKVKQFMQDIVELAKKQGYVSTLSGRVRRIPELSSSIYSVRAFGERAAMNMPLQGTASDIIKLAMIRVWNRLREEGLGAKLILQVHDELVVDTPPEEVDKVERILAEEMEGVMKLSVPLEASISSGFTWLEAK